jgi:hypothetical protein
MIFLGVVAEEPLVCYGVILQKVKLLSDAENPQLAMFAAMILKGRSCSYTYLRPMPTGRPSRRCWRSSERT